MQEEEELIQFCVGMQVSFAPQHGTGFPSV